MAARAAQWPNVAFAFMPETRRRAIRFESAMTLRFIRILGICFALLAMMMLYYGLQHYLWIKKIEALSF
jgi:hypothetical protein